MTASEQIARIETWVVEYSDHDCGSSAGHFVRKSEEQAKRSAELMKQCGYQTVTHRKFA